MLRSVALVVTMVCSISGALTAQRPLPNATIHEGVLSFDGHASTGDFSGITSTVTGQMTGGADLTAVRGWVESPVQTLKTGKDRRDRDLNKSMESDKFPNLRFELTGVTPGQESGDTTAVTLRGRFLIHGVTREVTMQGSVVLNPGQVRLRSDFPLNLTDYQIGGLSKMLGILKMYPDIVVHVDLTFQSE